MEIWYIHMCILYIHMRLRCTNRQAQNSVDCWPWCVWEAVCKSQCACSNFFSSRSWVVVIVYSGVGVLCIYMCVCIKPPGIHSTTKFSIPFRISADFIKKTLSKLLHTFLFNWPIVRTWLYEQLVFCMELNPKWEIFPLSLSRFLFLTFTHNYTYTQTNG